MPKSIDYYINFLYNKSGWLAYLPTQGLSLVRAFTAGVWHDYVMFSAILWFDILITGLAPGT